MTVLAVLRVLAVLESTLPSCFLSYKIQHNEATMAVLTVLAVSAVVAVSVVTATPLTQPPFSVILRIARSDSESPDSRFRIANSVPLSFEYPCKRKAYTHLFCFLNESPQDTHRNLHLYFSSVSELVLRRCKFSCRAKHAAPDLHLHFRICFGIYPNLRLHCLLCAKFKCKLFSPL